MTTIARNYLAIGVGLTGSLAILAAHQYLSHTPLPDRGEYFLSHLLIQNYTGLTEALLLFLAAAICFTTGANCIAVASSMVVVLPAVAVYEGTVYPASHNLIGIKFVIHAIYGLPPLVGAWLGVYGFKQRHKRSI
jgi:hypothetical protein